MGEPARGPGRTKRVGTPAAQRHPARERADCAPFSSRYPWRAAALGNAALWTTLFFVRYWYHRQPFGESLSLTLVPGIICFLLLGSLNMLLRRWDNRSE